MKGTLLGERCRMKQYETGGGGRGTVMQAAPMAEGRGQQGQESQGALHPESVAATASLPCTQPALIHFPLANNVQKMDGSTPYFALGAASSSAMAQNFWFDFQGLCK